jgi:hypothetical protein
MSLLILNRQRANAGTETTKKGKGASHMAMERITPDLQPGQDATTITYDRFNALAAEFVGIVVDALRAWLRGDLADLREARMQIASRLREEFAEIERAAAGERTAGLE